MRLVDIVDGSGNHASPHDSLFGQASLGEIVLKVLDAAEGHDALALGCAATEGFVPLVHAIDVGVDGRWPSRRRRWVAERERWRTGGRVGGEGGGRRSGGQRQHRIPRIQKLKNAEKEI